MDNGAMQHQRAVSIEHEINKHFKPLTQYRIRKVNFGGIFDASSLKREGGFYHAVTIVLGKYYTLGNVEMIETMLEQLYDFEKCSLEDISSEVVKSVFDQLKEFKIASEL